MTGSQSLPYVTTPLHAAEQPACDTHASTMKPVAHTVPSSLSTMKPVAHTVPSSLSTITPVAHTVPSLQAAQAGV
jgi:hypothetical protein